VALALVAIGATGQLVLASTQANSDFDFFYFVRQWPGSFCSEHKCPLFRKPDWYRFTIHGLWPNYNAGGWPEFCDKDKAFDESLIDDLVPQMELAWPSYMDDSDSENFWAHEWNKHGTCALAELPSEHKYFKTVLKLHWKYDLMAALEDADITPSDKARYGKAQLEDAIRKAYGVDALIHCSQDGKLTEIWMCIDKDLKPFDCKASAADTSHCKEILMPVPAGAHKKILAEDGASEDDQDRERDEDHDHDSDHDHDHDEGRDDDDDEQEDEDEERGQHSYTIDAATQTEAADALAAQQAAARAARPHLQRSSDPGIARVLIIASAGIVMVAIMAVTVAASWAKRGTADGRTQQQQQSLVIDQRRVHYVQAEPAQAQATADVEGGELQQPLLPKP